MRDADTAMYRAKGEGSGYAVFGPDMYDRAFRRLEAENDLRRAVERGSSSFATSRSSTWVPEGCGGWRRW